MLCFPSEKPLQVAMAGVKGGDARAKDGGTCKAAPERRSGDVVEMLTQGKAKHLLSITHRWQRLVAVWLLFGWVPCMSGAGPLPSVTGWGPVAQAASHC